MLSINNLSCGYNGLDVVRGITFSCKKSECLSIIGPNGCGKTTILRALSGILPYKGTIILKGKELNSLSRKQISSEIALMTQISNIYFSYSVYETVALGRYLHIKRGLLSSILKEDKDVILSCLEDAGLIDIKDKDITALSGGQLQRVYLARIFAQEPKIILLDEPTNYLDLKYQSELINKLKQWVSKGDRAIIGVFHDLNMSMHLSEKTLLLDDGKVAAFGETKEILNSETLSNIYGINVKEYMNRSLSQWE